MVKLNGGYLKEKLNIVNIQDRLDLRLSSKGIDEIEPTLFHNCHKLVILDLSWNRLKSLAKNLFANCASLKELYIDRNNVEEIEPTLFHHCHKLEKLYLYSNQLKTLDKNLFSNCTNLVRLSLTWNNIAEIEPTLFDDCQKLELLELSCNKLKSLDKNLFAKCANLIQLNLGSNDIDEIEPTLFHNCHKLTILSLSSNRLKTLDKNLFAKCANLKELNLNLNNNIDALEVTLFHKCQKLERLSLSSNRLKTLDKNLFVNCTNLKELDLGTNDIDVIEPTLFHNCHQLEELNLESNRLKTLDKRLFSNCTNLKELTIGSNNIDELEPTIFYNCKKLETLVLSRNQLKTLDENLLVTCTSLKRLYLDENNIADIESTLFHECQELELLELNSNRIRSLDKSLFAKCTNLKELNLNLNEIDALEANLFHNCQKLEALSLSSNQLKTLDVDLLAKCSNLKKLMLDHNNIDKIEPTPFQQYQNLETLDLSWNQLTSIDKNLFVKCVKLKELYLDAKELHFIDNMNNKKIYVCFSNSNWISFQRHDCLILILRLTQNVSIDLFLHQYKTDENELCIIDERNHILNQFPLSHQSKFLLHFNEKGHFVSKKDFSEIDLSIKYAYGNRLLHIAALENQSFIVGVYLERHYAIFHENVKKQTPIHLASLSGSLDFIETLVKVTLRREIDKPDVNGHTPLMLAAMNGQINVLGFLLKQNVNVNHQDIENEDSLLHLLVKRERNKALEFILKWNAQEENGRLDINVKNKQGRTALHCAADCANEEAIYYLCSFDADTSMLDSENKTPFNLAIQSKCPHIERRKQSVMALIKWGVDYSQIDINTIDDQSLTDLIANYTTLNGELSTPLFGSLLKIYSGRIQLNSDLFRFQKSRIDYDSAEIPQVIYEFYSKGSDREIEFFKRFKLSFSSVNTLGDNVFHIAAKLGDKKCIEKLFNSEISRKSLMKCDVKNNNGDFVLDLIKRDHDKNELAQLFYRNNFTNSNKISIFNILFILVIAFFAISLLIHKK